MQINFQDSPSNLLKIPSQNNEEKIHDIISINSSSQSNFNEGIPEEKPLRFKRKSFIFHSNYSQNKKRKLREINKKENTINGREKLYQQLIKITMDEKKANDIAKELYRVFCVLNPTFDKLTNEKFKENLMKLIRKVKQICKKRDEDLLFTQKKYESFIKKIMKMPNIEKKTTNFLKKNKEIPHLRQLRKTDIKLENFDETRGFSISEHGFEGDSLNNNINIPNPQLNNTTPSVTLERKAFLYKEQKKRENVLMKLTFTFDQIKRIKFFYENKGNFNRNCDEIEKDNENNVQNNENFVNNKINENKDERKKLNFWSIPEENHNEEEEKKSEKNGQIKEDLQINEDLKKTDEIKKLARKSVISSISDKEKDEEFGIFL